MDPIRDYYREAIAVFSSAGLPGRSLVRSLVAELKEKHSLMRKHSAGVCGYLRVARRGEALA